MKLDLSEAKHHFLSRAFFLFLVIGTFNTFFCSALAKAFEAFLLNANLSFNIGYLVANLTAYFLNARIIFPSRMTFSGYIRFFLSYVPNYVIQNGIVFLAYNLLGLPSLLAYVIAAVLGVPVTFLFVKIFAFGRR